MPPGKAASQAGHAFLDSFLSAAPALQSQYLSDGHGTKVVLVAPDAAELARLYNVARDLGVPAALVVDSGHVMPPHFDGSEITTAVGIGPMNRDEADIITKELRCMR